MENNAEQTAYPTDNTISNKWIDPADFHSVRVGGLTKRELLAAMAMQGILSGASVAPMSFKEAAARSIAFANELLSQLQSKP